METEEVAKDNGCDGVTIYSEDVIVNQGILRIDGKGVEGHVIIKELGRGA